MAKKARVILQKPSGTIPRSKATKSAYFSKRVMGKGKALSKTTSDLMRDAIIKKSKVTKSGYFSKKILGKALSKTTHNLTHDAIIKKSKATKSAYLSKRVMVRALRKATRNLNQDAMERMGYVVTIADGWVVRKPKTGKTMRINKLHKVKSPKKVVLD